MVSREASMRWLPTLNSGGVHHESWLRDPATGRLAQLFAVDGDGDIDGALHVSTSPAYAPLVSGSLEHHVRPGPKYPPLTADSSGRRDPDPNGGALLDEMTLSHYA